MTDFFEFGFIEFPVFNVADACIFIGVAILMVWILFGPEESGDAEADEAAPATAVEDAPVEVPSDRRRRSRGRLGRREPGVKPSDYFEHTVAPDEAGMRLDVLLGSLEFLASRSAAARLIDDGLVLVDGESAPKKHMVKAGEKHRGRDSALRPRATSFPRTSRSTSSSRTIT